LKKEDNTKKLNRNNSENKLNNENSIENSSLKKINYEDYFKFLKKNNNLFDVVNSQPKFHTIDNFCNSQKNNWLDIKNSFSNTTLSINQSTSDFISNQTIR